MGVLVEVDELARLLAEDRPPVLIDVRWTLGGPSRLPDFLNGHIPGAHWVDLETELSDHQRPGGRHPLPERAAFEASMRRVGVRNDSTVIIYDADNALAASRLWWMLRDAGRADVRVLNGGFAAWLADLRPTESGPGQQAVPGDFTADPDSLPKIDGPDLADRIAAGNPPVIIDVRGPERYAGESEPIDPVAGHIPGAINVPSMINIGADGRFRDPAEIAANFPAGDEAPVVYCGSGITAAHTALARQVAGLSMPTVYPGSWSDWISDPERPVATGAQP
ncbi:sulfurtransferase [Microlunatus elymi]|uniref:Sulfurtransferase n=1 Tax=Microlunatus elymi TaxID=2596828 RepID=A0A516PZE0_9ACTN|nr:sulfurtransferase [Microlunatus elymi]QDP96545.1 sulfurtransferase [Microlunatus elymi]